MFQTFKKRPPVIRAVLVRKGNAMEVCERIGASTVIAELSRDTNRPLFRFVFTDRAGNALMAKTLEVLDGDYIVRDPDGNGFSTMTHNDLWSEYEDGDDD